MRGRPLATALALAAAIGCAKVAPPPGGPEDLEPPKVVEIIPPRDATGVAPDSALTLVFSEKVDRRSVMRGLSVFPRVDFRRTDWEEARVRLVPEDGWATDRPTLFVVARTARDRRGNDMGTPFRTRFFPGAVADSGEVSGRIWAGREVPRGTMLLVAAYPAGEADSVDFATDAPVALADARADGTFRLDGLDVAGTWRIVGMLDRDDDARPASRGEVWAEAVERVRFPDPADPSVEVADFLVGTLDSLGSIAGEVKADSASMAVVFAETEETRASESLEGGGRFSLAVPTGAVYRVAAFVDTDGDSLPGPAEPLVDFAEPVSLELTAERSGLLFDLTGLVEDAGPEELPPPEEPDEETQP